MTKFDHVPLFHLGQRTAAEPVSFTDTLKMTNSVPKVKINMLFLYLHDNGSCFTNTNSFFISFFMCLLLEPFIFGFENSCKAIYPRQNNETPAVITGLSGSQQWSGYNIAGQQVWAFGSVDVWKCLKELRSASGKVAQDGATCVYKEEACTTGQVCSNVKLTQSCLNYWANVAPSFNWPNDF